jgi:hypothetical protein
LLTAEWRELKFRAAWALPAWCLAIVFTSSSLSALLIAFDYYLMERFEIDPATGMVWAALAAFGAAVACAVFGWWLMRLRSAFSRTREELTQTIQLLKTALSHQTPSARE